jgi:hypothetical protein
MPPRILRDVLVVDRSALARNMYQLLFSAQSRFRVLFAEEYQSLFKRSRRLRPDLLVANSNALDRHADVQFPCPAIVVISKDRLDLKEHLSGRKDVVVIEKPFYPYDLISVANRLLVKAAGRKIKRPGVKKRGPKKRHGE